MLDEKTWIAAGVKMVEAEGLRQYENEHKTQAILVSFASGYWIARTIASHFVPGGIRRPYQPVHGCHGHSTEAVRQGAQPVSACSLRANSICGALRCLPHRFRIAQPTWLIRALVGVAALATVVISLFVVG